MKLETLERALRAMETARHALAAAPGDNAWRAYMEVMEAASNFERELIAVRRSVIVPVREAA